MNKLIPPNLGRLLRVREFVLLWSGSTVSLFGDGIYFVTIAWEVYRISNLPTALGIVSAAFSLPQVALLVFGGVLSDRMDRRLLMLWMNLVSALMIGILGALVLLNRIQLWEIVVLVAVYGVSQAFFLPASRAIVPSLVAADLVPQAMAMEQFIQPLTGTLLGPALGGLLIAAGGTGFAFLIDAATFLVAAATLSAMAYAPPASAGGEPGERPSGRFAALHEAGLALAFIRRRPWMWAGLAAAAIANVALTGPLVVLIPFLIKYRLHAGPEALGLVGACGGLGAILAAIYVSWRGVPRRDVIWMLICWSAAPASMIPMGLVNAAWQLMPLTFVTMAGLAIGNMIWFARMGVRVPGFMLGRVSSFDMMLSYCLIPLSMAITGPIAGVIGVRQVFFWAGAAACVVTLIFLVVPDLQADD
ncbi:MAG: MFS transporter [Candidatus Dormiibacterota bacterium]